MAFEPDSEALFRQLIQEELAKTQNPNPSNGNPNPAPATPAAQPMKLQIGSQVMEFQDPSQLQGTINQLVTEVVTDRARMQAQIEQLQQRSAPANQVSGSDAPNWDLNQFVDTMTKDPREAINLTLNHLLFEGKSQNAAKELSERLQRAEGLEKALAAAQFKERHPEFARNATPQFADTIDQVRQYHNLPYDADGLEAAYTIAVNKGAIPNFSVYEAQQVALRQAQEQQAAAADPFTGMRPQSAPPPFAPAAPLPGPMDARQFNGGGAFAGLPSPAPANNPYLMGPPRVGRGGFVPPQGAPANVDDLSTDQIERIFAQMGNSPYGR